MPAIRWMMRLQKRMLNKDKNQPRPHDGETVDVVANTNANSP